MSNKLYVSLIWGGPALSLVYSDSFLLVCCSDVGEALVSKGLAKVVRHRQDDENRSSRYDTLLAAETRAEKKGTGMHSKKEYPMHRVADISGVSLLLVSFF